MSIYSTMDITKEDAKQLLKKELQRQIDDLDGKTDNELADDLFYFFSDKTWNNFSIVPEYKEVDEYNRPTQFEQHKDKFEPPYSIYSDADLG
jgi:hypothetical protein